MPAVNTKQAASAFKRLPIGTSFNSHRGRFRKVSGTKVVALNENGTGRTHEKLSFPKNTHCEPL